MKNLIFSHLNISERLVRDFALAIEECKDCDMEDYLYALYHHLCYSVNVLRAMKHHWPDEFSYSSGIYTRYCRLRIRIPELYKAMLASLDRTNKEILVSETLPF